jgi:hypothetical protein
MMDFLDLDEYGNGKPTALLEPRLTDQHGLPRTFMTPTNSTSVSSNVSPDGRTYMDVWPLRQDEMSVEQNGGFNGSMEFNQPAAPIATSNDDSYHSAQQELSSLTFGRIYDDSSMLDDELRHALHSREDWTKVLQGADTQQYEYNLFIGGLPLRSRVETQIKCRLVLSPSPPQHLLHLPWDTISRPRFQLRERFSPTPNTLLLEVDVVSASNPRQPILMCDKCLNREKKRAFRKKNLDTSEQRYWSDGRLRRLAIFNCKEVVSIPLEKSCAVENANAASSPLIVQGREIHLPLRLACYSRHHSAKNGYR